MKIALVTLLALDFVCVSMLGPKIESQITARAQAALAESAWASVTVDGRTLLVQGIAPLSERAFAARRLRGVAFAGDVIFTDEQNQFRD